MVDDKDNTARKAAEAEYYAHVADVSNTLRESVIHSAIQALKFPPGSHGLDAGCGTGLQAIPLAEVVGPSGHVTGLDLSPELLVYAQNNVENAGLSKRVTFKEGNVIALSFDDNTFDWAWSMDCVGYLPLDQVPMILELARVVRPGGRVAILAWSSEILLPGYPHLEARLKATAAGIAPFVIGMKPETHFLRALGWFDAAGLEDAAALTFAGDAYAPLNDDLRLALEALLQMRWPGVQEELTREEWADYQRLCLPDSPEYILNQPDYYSFFTYTMFCGFVRA